MHHAAVNGVQSWSIPASGFKKLKILIVLASASTFFALLGIFEVTGAVLIAIKPLAPRLSVVGSLIAILLFLATISFLFTTPGVSERAGGGFPTISLTGEFLLKDVPLPGLSFWTLADSIRAAARQVATTDIV